MVTPPTNQLAFHSSNGSDTVTSTSAGLSSINSFGNSVHAPAPRLPANNTNRRQPRRVRTQFTSNQIMELEEQFKKNPYISRASRIALGLKLNLLEQKIKIWFQNRRMKVKKDKNASQRRSKPPSDVTNVFCHNQSYSQPQQNTLNITELEALIRFVPNTSTTDENQRVQTNFLTHDQQSTTNYIQDNFFNNPDSAYRDNYNNI